MQKNSIKTNLFLLENPHDYDRKIYYINLYRIKRPSPIQMVEFRSYRSGIGELQLTLRTPLEYNLIKNSIYHCKYSRVQEGHTGGYHRYFLWEFELIEQNKNEIEMLINDIFNHLIPLVSDMETKIRLSDIHDSLNKTLKRHFWIHNKNFFTPANYIEYEAQTPNSKGAKELFSAITQSNSDKVYELLSHNADPNSYYENFSALNYAINADTPLYPSNSYTLSARLSIIALLLEYGANPMLETYGLTTLERTVNESIFESMFRLGKINVEYFNQIMNFLTASAFSRPHISITETAKKTYHGYIVHGSNMFLKELYEKPAQHPKLVNVIYRGNNYHFLMSDNVEVSVKSYSGYQVEQNEYLQDDLFKLFKQNCEQGR